MMFDAPDRIETERLGLEREPQIARIDLMIRQLATRVLKDDSYTDVHHDLLEFAGFDPGTFETSLPE
jgi:hypothetical protein